MNKTITVRGKGTARLMPDIIELSLQFYARNASYANAMAEADKKLEQLHAAVLSAGFARKDLKTTSFNVQSEYDNVRAQDGNYTRVFKGFVCTHALKLEFNFDLTLLNNIFAALADCHAQPELTVRFTVKDKDALKAEALGCAVKDAQQKAAALARAANANLGGLLSIEYTGGSENFASPTQFIQPRLNAVQFAAPAADIVPEDITIEEYATLVWEINQ